MLVQIVKDGGQSFGQHLASHATEKPRHEHALHATETSVLLREACSSAGKSLKHVGDDRGLVSLLIPPVIAQQRGLIDS